MSDGWGKHRRGALIFLAAILAAAALAAVLVTVATARPLDFLHIRTNLSHTANLVSADPDLATSPDGSRVAVVWTEGYTGAIGNKGHVYLRAASEADAGWSGKIPVFGGGRSAYAYDTALAITGTEAHIAYVVGLSDRTEVRYKSCDLQNLSDVSCTTASQVSMPLDASDGWITQVDLALDERENPHIVWAWRDAVSGTVAYRALGATGWGSIEIVASDGDNNRPAIAWADGYAHVVWEERTAPSIMYWRGAGLGGGSTEELCSSQMISYTVPNPDVVARVNRVFVVWEQCADFDGPICREYNLVYQRSNNSGSDWGEPLEVGTDAGADAFTEVYSSANFLAETYEFLLYLRPSIALNGDGWPVVVWHAKSPDDALGTEYVIYYSYASSGASDSLDWEVNPPSTLFTGTLGSAAVGVGQGDSSQLLHVAFVQQVSANAWDVFYGSSEEDRYPHIYLPLVAKVYSGPAAASCAAASGERIQP